MHELQKMTGTRSGWINRTGLATGGLPILALGVFANFAWVALVFWAVSYWIAWR